MPGIPLRPHAMSQLDTATRNATSRAMRHPMRRRSSRYSSRMNPTSSSADGSLTAVALLPSTATEAAWMAMNGDARFAAGTKMGRYELSSSISTALTPWTASSNHRPNGRLSRATTRRKSARASTAPTAAISTRVAADGRLIAPLSLRMTSAGDGRSST